MDKDGTLSPFSVEAYELMGQHLVEGWFDTVKTGLKSAEFTNYVFGHSQIALPPGHGASKGAPEIDSVLKSIAAALAGGEE